MTGHAVKQLSFTGKNLSISDEVIELPYEIQDAIAVDGSIFVIYDSVGFPIDQAALNLVRINAKGEELWKAGNPKQSSTDAYTGFHRISKQGKGSISAFNFSGLYCVIDTENGRLINAKLTK